MTTHREQMRTKGAQVMNEIKDGLYHVVNPEGKEFDCEVDNGVTSALGFYVQELIEMGFRFTLIAEYTSWQDDDEGGQDDE